MPVLYDEKNKIFNVYTKNFSLVFGIFADKVPILIHCGKRIKNTYNMDKMLDYKLKGGMAFAARNKEFNNEISLETVSVLYPTYGNTDVRMPAISIMHNNGTMCSNFYYKSHKITDGKENLEILPSVYCEEGDNVQTLTLTLYDEPSALTLTLSYSAFYDYDIITQNVKLENAGERVKIDRIMSAAVDLPDKDFDFVHLYGNWARERQIQRTPLFNGGMTVDSKRGSSSAHHNPFFALARKNADEFLGEVFGFSLLYSGNFTAGVEVDSIDNTRAFIGINPFNFGWTLEKGESFTAPEGVMCYSCEGFSKMSDNFQKIARQRICRGKYRDIERPVLLNNWEATYFDFNEEKLIDIAKKAKSAGVELFVLDDGWFGKRDDDKTSLGDWFVDKAKLPNGIDGLAKKINDMGLKFGLWFEPEAISPKSELYKKHPDWCLHIKGRVQNESRNEYLLDLSRDEVCDYIVKFMSDILSSANIEYIKWDMNRNMTDIGNEVLESGRQCEIVHRYMLGLYRVLDTLNKKFPNVLFEGCSGGGGRFDFGMLQYFPQIWTSDDSDAVERLYIQHGTSMLYPTSAMGAHVSAVPNHQVHRVTPIDMRGHVAMCGQFGYELDLNKLSDEEFEAVKEQIKLYKKISHITHKGTMYRLLSPFEGNYTAWEFVSEDESEIVLMIANIIKRGGRVAATRVLLKGLDENANYIVENTGEVYGGDFLMNIGFIRMPEKDFESELLIIKKVK